MLPAGLAWPRPLLDADTAAATKAGRVLADCVLKAGWLCLATGAPAAGLARKFLAQLPEATALHISQTDPVVPAEAQASLTTELPGLPILSANAAPSLNGGQRLVTGLGMAASRADLCPLGDWLSVWAELAGADGLLAFTLPAWRDPALLEAWWSQANPGATVEAAANARTVRIETDGSVAATITHIHPLEVGSVLQASGFELVGLADGGGVLAIVARRS